MTTTSDNPTQLLSPKELAEELGIPVQTIYKWRTEGLGPEGIAVGRHIRFMRADVYAWLESNKDRAREMRRQTLGGSGRSRRPQPRKRKPSEPDEPTSGAGDRALRRPRPRSVASGDAGPRSGKQALSEPREVGQGR